MKTLQLSSLLFLSLCVGLVADRSARAQHDDHASASAQEPKPAKEFRGDPYLLDTDPVTGKKLGPIAEQRILDHQGRELRFASEKNEKAFLEDPAKYLPKIDAAMIAQQTPFYPLPTCPVSGEKLGESGKPVELLYKNRLVRLCCGECKDGFLKDPSKHVAKIEAAAIEAQAKTYPAETCIVSGEPFGGDMGEPIDYILGHRMVRLCCKGCVKKLRKDPLGYLAKLEAAKKDAKDAHDHGKEGGHGKDGGHGHGDRR